MSALIEFQSRARIVQGLASGARSRFAFRTRGPK
jgi:hypothetical protein